jgi:hypothetical protein
VLGREGLLREDIEDGTGDPSLLKGSDQGGLLDERASSKVHEPGLGSHGVELGLS